MSFASIHAISYYLPEQVVTNNDLKAMHPDWEIDAIARRTGVYSRHISAEGEIASDLAYNAAVRLFEEHSVEPASIDFLLFCTQCPDYFSPATSPILQDRLGIPVTAGALDFNLGCTGFVYGLGHAKGLVESLGIKNVLLLTGETISNYLHPADRAAWCLFGDGGSATLISGDDRSESAIGPFVFGTDGKGSGDVIQVSGGARNPLYRKRRTQEVLLDDFGYVRNDDYFYMNGTNIFIFALKRVPKLIRETLDKAKMAIDDIDLFVFHQANDMILQVLRRKLQIAEDKFFIFMEHCGNTVSASIPIALYEAMKQGKAKMGDNVLVAGFGVGHSWAATIIQL